MKTSAGIAVALAVLSLTGGRSWSDAAPPVPPPGLDQITVEAQRERALLEREVSTYVSAITVAPFQESLARWRNAICPLVAGLPRDHGEFILKRVSQIAGDAGVPLAPDHCRGNFYVVVTANPDALAPSVDEARRFHVRRCRRNEGPRFPEGFGAGTCVV